MPVSTHLYIIFLFIFICNILGGREESTCIDTVDRQLMAWLFLASQNPWLKTIFLLETLRYHARLPRLDIVANTMM